MADSVIIFRAASDVEASLVRGLLEANGIPSMVVADGMRTLFPVPATDLGSVRVAVPVELADEARRLIAAYHQEEARGSRVVRLRDQFSGLEDRLGYHFRDEGLLEHALTHRSRAHEDVTGGVADNESLEFLGDAVLGFVIADALFRECPQLDEGQKSKVKASLVSAGSLGRLGEQLGLGEHLLLGRGEEKTGGRRKAALLANACEALIAAVYLDGGLEAARGFILRALWQPLGEISRPGLLTALTGDYKSALQEALQARDRPLPAYRVAAESGPDHDKQFLVEAVVDGVVVASAEGRTKKEAEQEAARHALEGVLEL